MLCPHQDVLQKRYKQSELLKMPALAGLGMVCRGSLIRSQLCNKLQVMTSVILLAYIILSNHIQEQIFFFFNSLLKDDFKKLRGPSLLFPAFAAIFKLSDYSLCLHYYVILFL